MMHELSDKQYKEYIYLKRKAKANKRGFIDNCYIIVSTCGSVAVVVSIILMTIASKYNWANVDALASVLSVIIDKTIELVMVFSAFVVWKAKVENCRKFKDVNLLTSLTNGEEQL